MSNVETKRTIAARNVPLGEKRKFFTLRQPYFVWPTLPWLDVRRFNQSRQVLPIAQLIRKGSAPL